MARTVIFKPYHVFAFNRCPILAYMNVDLTPPYARCLRTALLDIARGYAKDPDSPPSMMYYLNEFDKEWRVADGALKTYEPSRKEKLASGAMRRLATWYGDLAVCRDQPLKIPKLVGVNSIKFLGTFYERSGESYHLYIDIPLDVILHDDTLLSMGVYGVGGSRINPYMTPLAMPHAWATLVWHAEHRLRDMSRIKRVINMSIKAIDGLENSLRYYLRGIHNVLSGPIIAGRFATTCKRCNRCNGNYFIETEGENGYGKEKETQGNN